MTIAGDTRSFAGLHAAAEDGANSRLWGGIHFSTDNRAGLLLGRQVGRAVISRPILATVPEPSTWTAMIVGFGLMGAAWRRQRRRAIGDFIFEHAV